MLASKHIDIVIGLDIHLVNIPPAVGVPLPHPFIGMVFDPMDYLPFLGATVNVNKMKRANASTAAMMGTFFHIPFGAGFTTAPLIAHDGVMFFGSQTVKAEGSNMGVASYMLMTCSCVGMPLSISFGKKLKNVMPSMYLPVSTTVPIPMGRPVNVGGPIVPDLMGAMMSLLMSAGLGFLMKIGARKLINAIAGKLDKMGGKFAKFGNFLKSMKCRMIGDPVDPASGRVLTPAEDFTINGPIPLKWERFWHSSSEYEGPLGHGWHHNYDWEIEIFPEDQALILRMEEGRHCAFPLPQNNRPVFEREERLTLTIEDNLYTIYDHEKSLYYKFAYQGNPDPRKLNLLSISNKAGHTIRFDYIAGKLQGITDSAGRELEVENDAMGRITAIRLHDAYDNDPFRLPLVRYEYSAEGDLTKVYDSMNKPTVMEYENHLMMAKTDRNGVMFCWDYDGTSPGARCIHTWGPEGLFEYWFDYHDGYTEVRNSMGQVTTYFYNAGGLIIKEVNPLGHAATTQYNMFQEVVCETNEMGESTYYGYDHKGNRNSILMPGGESMEIMFEDDKPVVAKNANDAVWLWEYDQEGLLESRIGPENDVTRYQYEDGMLSAIIDADGETTKLEYDKQFNLVRMHLPGDRTAKWQYNYKGLCTRTVDPSGQIEAFIYDQLDRVKEVIRPDHNHVFLQYDAYDDVLEARDTYHDIKFEYTPLGSLKTRIENDTKLEFFYDNEENLTSIKNEAGSSYYFKRDNAANIIEETGFDNLTRKYRRDAAGRVIEALLPDGRKTRYSYDRGGRITKIEHDDGTIELYSYDREGNLVEAVNEDTRVAIERNIVGRVTKEVQGFAEVYSTYDLSGRRTKLATNLGAEIDLEYNRFGDQTGMQAHQGAMGLEARFGYDSFGREVERMFSNGVKSQWQYSMDGKPTAHIVTSGSTKFRYKKYRWDVNDRLRSIIDQLTGSTVEFSHDLFGSLAGAKYSDGTYDLKIPDVLGNLYRTEERKDREYGAAGQLLESPQHRYEYDKLGNLKAKYEKKTGQYWLYEWNDTGMLKKVTRPDGKDVTFKYDALGRRIEKNFDGKTTKWVWDGNVPVHEWEEEEQGTRNKEQGRDKKHGVKRDGEVSGVVLDKEGNVLMEVPEDLITWIFEEDGFAPMGKIQGDESFSIITDYLGTPCQMYNDRGRKTWECELDIYGKIRYLKSTRSFNFRQTEEEKRKECPFRYQGQYEDAETGLYYNRFRYYDPENGVYVSQDPIGLLGGNPNMYGYVIDSNLLIDIFGLLPWAEFMNGASATISNGSVTETFSSSITGHAEINGLNSFANRGLLEGKDIEISKVIGDFRPSASKPVGICTNCRSYMFKVLEEGGAKSITMPMTKGGKTIDIITISSENFGKVRAELDNIRKKSGSLKSKSDEAWSVLKKHSICK